MLRWGTLLGMQFPTQSRHPFVAEAALLVLLTLAPGAVHAQGEEEEEVPDLPVVELSADPVRELVSQAANPALSEEVGLIAFRSVVTRGGAAVPTLAAIYRDPQSGDRENWVAARAMASIGDEGCFRTLVYGLQSSRIISRLGAASGLETLADPRSTDALEAALFDHALVVRAYAADALASIGSKTSAGPLSEALDLPANYHQGKSLFVRRHIVDALGALGSIRGIDALLETLDDPDPQLAVRAAQALEQITGTSYRDASVAPGAPPSADEIEKWRVWWSERSVGSSSEAGKKK